MGKKRGKDAKSYGLGDCEGGEWSLLDKAESSSSYNAFDFSVYENVGKALEEADKDPRVVVAVLTGIGAYYSSGNDLNNFYIDNPTRMMSSIHWESLVLLNSIVICLFFQLQNLGRWLQRQERS